MDKIKLLEIAQALDLGSIDDKKARTLLLGLLGVSGSTIADLNHITINSAMNIMALTDNEQKVQDECGKIIDAIRTFSKYYR